MTNGNGEEGAVPSINTGLIYLRVQRTCDEGKKRGNQSSVQGAVDAPWELTALQVKRAVFPSPPHPCSSADVSRVRGSGDTLEAGERARVVGAPDAPDLDDSLGD